MTADPVEILRAVYRQWGAGDFVPSLEVFDPDAVLVMRPEFPDAGTYHGREGIARYTREFLDPWTRITIEADELVPVGDSVVAAVVQRGVGQGSGAETEFRYFHVWTFRGPQAIRLETFREREEALRAAGAE